jgi:hypothetical protein
MAKAKTTKKKPTTATAKKKRRPPSREVPRIKTYSLRAR